MKTITKEYTVYDYSDLKKDDELCDRIYQKFWLDNQDHINHWADENLNSFKKFAETLNMGFDYSEVERILKNILPRIEISDFGKVNDINGNTVGKFTVERNKEEF